MKEIAKLKKIGRALLNNELDYLELSQAIKDYRELLQGLTEIDLDDEKNRADIHFDNGKALGTTWAAMCVDDLMRTKRFVKGIHEAIQYLKHKKDHPLHILYAGTGPYAALVLPLLAMYSESDVQFTLLEVNKFSYNAVKQVLSKLGFLKFIKVIACEDASTYRISKGANIDMIISETMQHALEKEQQVPIMINLFSQVDKDVVIIPAKINLRLAALKVGKLGLLTKDYLVLGELFELSKTQIRAFVSEKAKNKGSMQFPKRCIELTTKQFIKYDYLSILTDIQVFKDERITLNESGLTIPKQIAEIPSIKKDKIVMKAQYKTDTVPGLEYELDY